MGRSCSLSKVEYLSKWQLKGKRPSGRPRRRWEDNIRMGLDDIGINAGNWVDSAQESPCECGIEPTGSISHRVIIIIIIIYTMIIKNWINFLKLNYFLHVSFEL